MGSQPDRKRKNFIQLGIGIGQAYAWKERMNPKDRCLIDI